MKAVLFAPLGSRHADAHARRLNAAGYDTTTWLQLHSGCIARDRSYDQMDQEAFRNLAFHLSCGAVCIIHPDTEPDQVQRVASLCRLLDVPMVRLADMPPSPPADARSLNALRRDLPLHRVASWARPHPLLRHANRFLQQMDRSLAGLKNPMVREQQQARHNAAITHQ